MGAPPPLELRLLGHPRARRDGVDVALGRREAAVACIAAVERRALDRSWLAALLWPDAAAPEANLRPVLSQLRKAVPELLVIERRTVRVAPGAWVDVHAVADGLDRLTASPAHVDGGVAADLAAALGSGGELAEGLELPGADGFELWLEAARRRAARLTGGARRAVAVQLERAGRLDEAIEVAAADAATAPYDDQVHDRLVRLLARAGRRSEALAHADAYARRIAADLGVERRTPTPAALATPDDGWRPAFAPPADDLSPLFGRASELEALRSLLRRSRLVTLVGPAGVGKSRLALEVARRVDDRAHGVAVVDLGAVTDPSDVPHALAVGLGLSPSLGDLGRQVATAVADLDLLLVLDSWERAAEGVRRAVDGILDAGRGAAVLAVGRRRLGVAGEAVLALGPLATGPDQAARALFVHHARAAGAGATFAEGDLRLVDRVCTRLEGHPLAIVLAARLDRWAGRSHRDVLAAVDAALDPSTGAGLLGELAPIVEASTALLTPAARSLLDHLAAVPGSCSAPTVAALVGRSPADVVPLLEELAEHSLLLREPAPDGTPRWRPPRVVAGHLRQRAGEGLPALVARHAEVVRQQLAGLGTFDLRDAALVDALFLDHEGHAQAFEHLCQEGRWADAAQVATGCHGTFSSRRWTGRGREWLERCLAHEEELPRPLAERVRFDLVKLCLVLDDRAGVEEHGAPLASALDPSLRSEAAGTRAALLLQTEPARAAELLDASTAALDEEGVTPGAAVWPRAYLGFQAMYAGDLALALDRLDAAIGEARALGQTNHLWTIEDTAASCALLLGRPAEVVRRLGSSRRPDTFWDAGDLLLGLALLDLGDLEAGRRAILAFADPALRRRLPRSANDALVGLAHLAAAEGDPEHAAEILGRSGRARLPASIGLGRSLARRLGREDRVAELRAELEAAGRLYASSDDLLAVEWRTARRRRQVRSS